MHNVIECCRRAADGEYWRVEKHFSGTFKSGDDRAKAGIILVSSGFGDDDDGQWTLKKVTHSFGGEGYVTKFDADVKRPHD